VEPVHRAELVAEGFREASPALAERLGRAAAWAVFPDVEDEQGRGSDGMHECLHPGFLFEDPAGGGVDGGDPGAVAPADPRPARLRCTEPPVAPAGVAYHLLVVINTPDELARLDRGGLELSGVPHRSPHDGDGPLPGFGGVWVVTSVRGGLFFDARDGHQVLELER
jgi:hypothetical protein